jgi:periplasmic protein TonB
VTLMELHRGSDHAGNHTAGWVISVVLHGSVVVGALLFVQRVQMAPQSEPFKWNVALVSSDSPPAPSSATSSLVENPLPTQPTNSATIQQTQPTSPVTEPKKPEPLQRQPLLMAATAPPTLPQQAEPQPVKPVAQTVIPISPLPVDPIEQTPVPVESVGPSRQSADSETVAVLAQRESNSAMVASPAHPESPTLLSSVPNPAPEPSPPSTPPVATLPSETSVPAASSAPQVAALAPSGSNRPDRVDYGWLSEVILRRVEELKRYPAEARVDRTEGKVVVKAVLNEDGSVDEVEIFQSSGSTTLDKAAVDLIRRAAPFSLPHLLGKPRVTVKIPMNYRLDR